MRPGYSCADGWNAGEAIAGKLLSLQMARQDTPVSLPPAAAAAAAQPVMSMAVRDLNTVVARQTGGNG